MWYVSVGILIFVVCLHVKDALLQTSHPYIFTINLRLREEEIPRLIADSVCGNNEAITPYFDYSEISLGDIENLLSEDSQFTLAQTLNLLDISLEDIYYILSGDVLTKTITVANLNVHQIYSRFLQYFIKDPMVDIPKILEVLRIDGDKFGTAVVFGTDQELLEILLQGSYSKTKLHRVLEMLKRNITLDEVFDFVRFAKLDEAIPVIKSEPSLSNVIEALNNLLVPDKVTRLFSTLNLTANDFYRNKAFSAVLAKVVDTQEDIIATAISSDKLVTNSHSLTLIDYKMLKSYSVLVAGAIGNPRIRHELVDAQIPAQPKSLTFTTVRKLNSHQYVKFPTSINNENLASCSAISVNVPGNSVLVEPLAAYFDSHGNLRINKTLKTIFNIGSPLICSDFIYGVADWEFNNNDTISFIPVLSSTELYNSNGGGYMLSVSTYIMDVIWSALETICSLLRSMRINVCPVFNTV